MCNSMDCSHIRFCKLPRPELRGSMIQLGQEMVRDILLLLLRQMPL